MSTAISKKVDLVALAGDVFHGPHPGVRSQVAFARGIDCLYQAGIPVYMSMGNHDPLSCMPDSLMSLPGLHIFGSEPESACMGREAMDGVMIFGASFQKSAATENLVSRFSRDRGIEVAVGVIHANVSGIGGHRDYGPCTLDDLRLAGMDVWCLGHVHASMTLLDDPLVLYSGASQGAHIKEVGPLGCFLITVAATGAPTAEFIPLAPVLWQIVRLDLDHSDDLNEVFEKTRRACEHVISSAGNPEALVARICLFGKASHGLRRSLDADKEMIDTLADYLGDLPVPVFLESLHDKTRSGIASTSPVGDQGLLAEFVKVRRNIEQDPAKLAELVQALRKELLKKVNKSYFTAGSDITALMEDPLGLTRFLDEATGLIFGIFGEPEGVDSRDLN